MIVVCPYTPNPKPHAQSDEVLRYALRSWGDNYEDPRIVLIGSKPSWYEGEHIPHQGPEEKYDNVLERLRITAEKYEEFTWTNDDIFVGDTWIKQWPQYHQGPLAEKVPQYGGRYRDLALRTVELTSEHVLNFGVHSPFHYEGDELLHLLDDIGNEPALIRTVYAHRYPTTQQQVQDRKAFHPGQVQDFHTGPWWSVNDSGPTVEAALRILRVQHPEPAPWEAKL